MKTVVQYVRRFQITASIIEMKRTCRRCDEEVDESGAMLEEEIYFGLHRMGHVFITTMNCNKASALKSV
jgi:hypothetical protein